VCLPEGSIKKVLFSCVSQRTELAFAHALKSAREDFGMTQLDSSIISALRSVLDEVCGHLPVTYTAARALVASSILECAHEGEQTYDDLKQAGIEALKRATPMSC
jgi:hypothetical protein